MTFNRVLGVTVWLMLAYCIAMAAFWGHNTILFIICACINAGHLIIRKVFINGRHRRSSENHRSGPATSDIALTEAQARVAAGILAYTGTSPSVNLPVEQSDQAIVAFKYAHLHVTQERDSVILVSLNNATPHAAGGEWGTAYCAHPVSMVSSSRIHINHGKTPELLCGCGFYAYKDPNPRYRGQVALMVELAGRVIEYTLGYRAEKQRILLARVESRCWHFLCQNTADVIDLPEPVQQSIYGTAGWVSTSANPGSWTPMQTLGVQSMRAWCPEHHPANAELLCTPIQIAAVLGIPVEFDDAWRLTSHPELTKGT